MERQVKRIEGGEKRGKKDQENRKGKGREKEEGKTDQENRVGGER